jgi:hypothetical protein
MMVDLLTPWLIGASLGVIVWKIEDSISEYRKNRRFKNNGYRYDILRRIVESNQS